MPDIHGSLELVPPLVDGRVEPTRLLGVLLRDVAPGAIQHHDGRDDADDRAGRDLGGDHIARSGRGEQRFRELRRSVRLPRHQRLQPVEQFEGLARGQLVGAGVAQAGLRPAIRAAAPARRGGGRRVNSGRSSARRARAPPCSPFSSISSTSSARAVTRLRQAGELGDMDAVGAVGGAGRDLVQKDDVALPFLDPHRVAGERRQLGGERRQFVVMGREEGAAAIDLVQVLERRPGDRQPVIGRGAAADLVEDDKGVRRPPGSGSPRSRPSRP